MFEQEERRLVKVWNDMIDEESQHCPPVFVEARVARMCELHFAAGRDFQREQEPKCRAALERIRDVLDRYNVQILMRGVDVMAEVRDAIAAGLDGEPEPPTPTLKDLREAAGLSVEWVVGVTRLPEVVIKEAEAGADWYLSDGTLHAFSLLYRTDMPVVMAAVKASREQRKESDAS